jgi:hypothetical protein
MPFAACTAEIIAEHGMVPVPALNVLATVAREGRNVWVRAGSSEPKLAAGDEVGV